jgi:hypothetical protein
LQLHGINEEWRPKAMTALEEVKVRIDEMALLDSNTSH